MSGKSKKVWFMTQEQYRDSGLDRCPHTNRSSKGGLEVCEDCQFVVTETF